MLSSPPETRPPARTEPGLAQFFLLGILLSGYDGGTAGLSPRTTMVLEYVQALATTLFDIPALRSDCLDNTPVANASACWTPLLASLHYLRLIRQPYTTTSLHCTCRQTARRHK